MRSFWDGSAEGGGSDSGSGVLDVVFVMLARYFSTGECIDSEMFVA